MSLRKLPNEIIATIARGLGLEDIFHLALSCHRFRGLIYDNNVAKRALEDHAPAAFEAMEAQSTRSYARGLRRLVKRRQALSSASPYHAAVVAVAETYLYRSGVLCYILERKLRILDLHHSSSQEICVDIRELLNQCIEESLGTRKYKFHLVHYSDGILTCRYTHARPDVENWLVMFHVRDRWAVSHRLESTYKLFVRNNRDYLYFGTHSDFGEDGFRRWVLKGYNFDSGRWLEQKVYLPDVVGSDIGNQVAFEIFDEHLYGISNQTSFEVEGWEWPSFYHVFRFPLDDPRPEKREMPARDSLWRRAHAEGPIDDRWTWLSLQRDEFGTLQILESRKEWLAGNSKGRRSLYRKSILFSPPLRDTQLPAAESPGSSSSNTSTPASTSTDWTAQTSPPPLLSPTTNTGQKKGVTPVSAIARPRLPQDVHPGDDPASTQLFTLSQSFIRYYHHPSSAFVDMIDMSDQCDSNTQKVQLRVMSRTPRPLETILGTPPIDEYVEPLSQSQAIEKIYRKSTLHHWPDETHPENLDPDVSSELDNVLNPPQHTGNLSGTWDDRSLLYATGGGRGGLKALVYLGFDPAIRLEGMKTRVRNESGEVVWMHGPQTPLTIPARRGGGEDDGDDVACETHVRLLEKRIANSQVEGQHGHSDGCPVRVAPGSSSKPPKAVGTPDSSWAKVEAAMFLDIQRGFNFAR